MLPRTSRPSTPFSGPGRTLSPLATSRRALQSPGLRRYVALFLAVWLAVLGIRWFLGEGPAALYDTTVGGRKALVVRKDYSDVKGENTGKWVRTTRVGMPKDVVLILCPVKNGIEHIWTFFQNLDSLTYPRHQIHLGFLVSDSDDGTWKRLRELVDERQKRRRRSRRYGRISMLKKDFLADGDVKLEPGQDLGNRGKGRHGFALQLKRRELLAKSRSWLLSSTLAPEVDWALWMDIDVDKIPVTLLQDLIHAAAQEQAEVVVPNCMWRTYDDIGPYDLNNWWETPESLGLKSSLGEDDVLIEGYEDSVVTHRRYLGRSYDFRTEEGTKAAPPAIPLDGVGGCCTLVHASVHRDGAVFPAYAFDHQMETEGFAQMAKRLGKKIVGLPTYHVYHGLYG